MKHNEILMNTIIWAFGGVGSGILVLFITLFFQKSGGTEKLKAKKNSNAFQADGDISNNTSNSNNTNNSNNTITHYHGSEYKDVVKPYKKAEIDEKKINVEQKISKPTKEDISELKKLIIDSENSNNTLKNYLSKNVVGELHKILFLQPAKEFVETKHLSKMENASRAPRVNSIYEPENIVVQRPHKVDKYIELKFNLDIKVNIYTRIHTSQFDSNDYSDSCYSYDNNSDNDVLFNNKCWLEVSGTISIGMDNNIFNIIGLSSLNDLQLEEKIKDMYADSIISIQSINKK